MAYGRRFSFNRDPKWITAKFNSHCTKCGEAIKKGDEIFYYPSDRTVLKGKCAEEASSDFNLHAQDDDFMMGQFPSGYFDRLD